MLVRINSIEAANNAYNMIANNSFLAAIAEKACDFYNVDCSDMEAVEVVAQTLSDIATSGLMTGYNGFVYTHDLVNFFDYNEDSIIAAFEDMDNVGVDMTETMIVNEQLTMVDFIARSDEFKCACVVRAVEWMCTMFEGQLEELN